MAQAYAFWDPCLRKTIRNYKFKIRLWDSVKDPAARLNELLGKSTSFPHVQDHRSPGLTIWAKRAWRVLSCGAGDSCSPERGAGSRPCSKQGRADVGLSSFTALPQGVKLSSMWGPGLAPCEPGPQALSYEPDSKPRKSRPWFIPQNQDLGQSTRMFCL